MPTLTSRSTGAASAASVLPDRPAQARRSSQRTRRLTEYIQAHTGENIEVVLTGHVKTACVLPADADSLIDADATDFDQQAARQLVDAVDGDYLVLISTNPANLQNLPIDDQLTADRAQQFGLSLHELGHIRYTNISVVASHLRERVDDEYQEFVHGLINYAEDAAIEHQLRAAQSQLAADRLELVNRSLTQMASDLPDTAHVAFTYRDAIQSYLYDHGIYDSGKSDVLLDPDDSRITFQSPDDATAFTQTQDALDNLLATVLSEPDSVKRGDAVLDCWEQTIKPLLDPMEEDDQQGQEGEDGDATGGSSPNSPPSPSPSESPTPQESGQGEANEPSTDPDSNTNEPDNSPENTPDGDGAADADPSDDSESPAGGSQETPGDTPAGEQGVGNAGDDASEASSDDTSSEPLADFDPENVSLEQTQDDHSADVLTYPDIGTAEEADELGSDEAESSDVDGDGAASESDAEPNTQPESADASPDEVEGGESEDESGSSAGDADSVGSEGEGGAGESSSGDLEDAPTGEGASSMGESSGEGQGDGDEDTSEGGSEGGEAAGASDGASNGQASLSDFLGGDSAGSNSGEDASNDGDVASGGADTSETPDTDGETADGSGAPDGPADGVESEDGGEAGDSTGGADGADTDSTGDESGDSAGEREETDDLDAYGDLPSELRESSEEAAAAPPEPAEPAYDDSLDDRMDALSADHDAAHDEADRATPDTDALERDLEETATALEDLAEDTDDTDGDDTAASRRRGGSGAGTGNLDSLSILPQIGEQAPPARWQAATAGADAVGGTLRMALRQSRRDQTRSGVTSGSFDRRRAGALARGDVNAFSVRQPGDEKQYDLVLVLDRSTSMSDIITTAEDAVTRFALACEDLGINVAIMDFIQNDARLIKPFSVETEHVQASLMSGETGGGTPLSDALGLARRLLDQRRDSPLVLVITDGEPGSTEDYQEELRQTFAPVCGLTLALDSTPGNPSDLAREVEPFYDRHLYVYDASDLDRRLDQFAVMFDGL